MLKRLFLSFLTGYILMYYGELMFWATPDREGFNFSSGIGMWLLYSLMSYPFLCVVSFFKADTPWAVFLAGAFYGWFEEGLVVQTMYGTSDGPFPMSISFTGLAWHAMIGVWIGWYFLRKVLTENNYLKTIALGSCIGLFYGLWAVSWWNEPPRAMEELIRTDRKDILLIHFTLFAFGTTAILALVHWVYERVRLPEFKPSKLELGVLIALVIPYYIFVTVPTAPKALWVFPILMGITLFSLNQNRKKERRPCLITAFPKSPDLLNCFLLFSIPFVASAVYFLNLANELRLPTNYIFYFVASPLAALLWGICVVVAFRKNPMAQQSQSS
jgi:hypothetical protein